MILDEERFQVIAQLGDASVVTQLVDMFFHDAPKHMAKALSASAAADQQELRRAAHTLKGSARTIGLAALGDACERIEDASKMNDSALVAGLVETLPSLLEQSRVAIYQRIKSL